MREIIRKAKTTIEVLLLAIIAAFVGATALGLFVDIFWHPESQTSDAFRGALWGAFFAFLFLRLSDALTRMYQANRNSRRALLVIQLTLNEALSISGDNLSVLEQWDAFYGILKSKAANAPTPVFANNIQKVPELRLLLMELSSIGLLNELFLLNSSIRKLNDSADTWQRAHQYAKDAFTSRIIDEATYIMNMDRGNKNRLELTRFFNALIEELIDALAATRLLTQYRPFLDKVFGWLNPDRYVEHTHPAHTNEIKKLRAEMEEIGAQSKARIESISPGATRPSK
jgi:hypothetical protein